MSAAESFQFRATNGAMTVTFTGPEIRFRGNKWRRRINKADFREIYIGRLGKRAECFISYEVNARKKLIHFEVTDAEDLSFTSFVSRLATMRPGSDISSMTFEQMCDHLQPKLNRTRNIFLGFIGFFAVLLTAMLVFGYVFLSEYAEDEGLAELPLSEFSSRVDSLDTRNVVLTGLRVDLDRYTERVTSSNSRGGTTVRYNYYHAVYPNVKAASGQLPAVIYYKQRYEDRIPELRELDSIQGVIRNARGDGLSDSMRQSLSAHFGAEIADNAPLIEIGVDPKEELTDLYMIAAVFGGFLAFLTAIILVATSVENSKKMRLRAEADRLKAQVSAA